MGITTVKLAHLGTSQSPTRLSGPQRGMNKLGVNFLHVSKSMLCTNII